MAKSTQTVRVVGNPGHIIGFQLGKLASNPGKKGSSNMAQKKPFHYHKPGTKKNPGHHKPKGRRNPGALGGGGLTNSITNALFVIVGALGSKLGAQAALGTNNTGPMGYFANAVAGGLLWFGASKLMHNKSASDGVISGTLVQIILRILNDFTPFGSYVNQLGMGDYQAQSFVTPQVLVDPLNSAQIKVPAGWAPKTVVMQAAAPMGSGGGGASAAIPGVGMSGLYNTRGRRLYAA